MKCLLAITVDCYLLVMLPLVLLVFLFTNLFPLHGFVHEFTIIVGVVRISPPRSHAITSG